MVRMGVTAESVLRLVERDVEAVPQDVGRGQPGDACTDHRDALAPCPDSFRQEIDFLHPDSAMPVTLVLKSSGSDRRPENDDRCKRLPTSSACTT